VTRILRQLLKRRVIRLVIRKRSRLILGYTRLVLGRHNGSCGCVAFLSLTCAVTALAQPAARFEVVSIKPMTMPPGAIVPPMGPVQGGPGTADPTRLTMHNMPMFLLVEQAYDVRTVQISGPNWIVHPDILATDDKFDIEARVPPGATKEQLPEMLQTMLAERFALKAHRETKEGPVYDLVVAKGGPKLHESPPAPELDPTGVKPGPKGADGFPTLPSGYSWSFVNMSAPGIARYKYVRRSMPEFAGELWGMLKKNVIDQTGLTGRYDFYLEVGRDLPAAPPAAAGNPPTSEPTGPSIPEALQSQLGLKLVDARGPIEMLVIDHIDRTPSQN